MIKSRSKPDYILIFIVVLLLLLGIMILADVSAVFSQEQFGKPTYYLFHQIIFGILPGLILGFFAFKLNLDFIKKWSLFFVLISLVLMSLVFIPQFGITSWGARRWLNFSIFSFQPSELLKLSFIIYLSSWLAKRVKRASYKKEDNWKFTFLPFLFIASLITILLAFQKNLSTLLIILTTGGVIYFISGTPFIQTFLMFNGVLLISFFLIKYFPYRIERILIIFNPLRDPMGLGYQLKQSLIAIGSGGLLGLGLGMSVQKFGFLPQIMSDSIFSIYAEETGFIGSLFLIILFLLFFLRGIKIAKRADDAFCRLYSIGVIFWICSQAFVNIGAMIGIMPLTGVPLPFIGYGGSHIVVELIAVGILLNISKNVYK